MKDKKLLYFIVGSGVLFVLLLGVFIFLETMPDKINRTYDPQNMTQYAEIFKDNKIPFARFQKSIDSAQINEPITELQIKNSGFEKLMKSGRPAYWNPYGSVAITSRKCYTGKNCLHVIADDTDYGIANINAEMIDVVPGKYYSASMMVNCLKCGGEGAYMTLVWMQPTTLDESGYEEIDRNILMLENTDGYKNITIYGRALENATKVFVGFRVHEESARITPLVDFYLDN